ncbi:CoA-binding domain-containing protein [Bifidobacterium sp. DSM 109958]|uniref:CoA-binding domain-containing protein n=1 Tax=Bifidobacterium moraviense TaxID=2675323 RepID=A0A7Y0F275_9BIFI|nr:CoA-binding protein [Bifidobacterium sp. DSM 109958]NMN00648.1 CoA-binding domain-containing protein [Bifidobacterium sp. DSM 109958]
MSENGKSAAIGGLNVPTAAQGIGLSAPASASSAACGVQGGACGVPAASDAGKANRRWKEPSADMRRRILERARSVAIVGASSNPARASYFVGTYLLQSSPYRVYFVNPREKEILGQPAYPDLASLPEVPDIVDVFRRAESIPPIADQAAAVGARVLWIQLGIWSDDVAEYAESLGLEVVMDRCLKIEHARFHQGLHLFGFNTGVISSRKAS